MPKETDFNNALDQAVAAVRATDPDRATVEAAAARVLARLTEASAAEAVPGAVDGCAGIRELLPAYKAGTLTEAREWLVQDHLRECAECRRAAQGSTRPAAVLPWPGKNAVAAPKRRPQLRLAWAAAMFVTVGLTAYSLRDRFLPAPEGARASLEWSDGSVYVVNAQGHRALANGGSIGENEWVRTAANTRALFRLADGSRVEMNELGEMNVSMNRRDTTVNVERGAIIVQAAKRSSGHLYVMTREASVAVTGTVFAVNRGMKGTRVSVAEGEVHVDLRGRTDVLRAGDQTSTSDTLPATSVRDEFAWSRNFDEHLKLMQELNVLARHVEQIQLPGLRYQSSILKVLPADTLVFVSIPNLGETLARAHQMFEDRLRDSEVLRKWWESQHAKEDPALAQIIELLRGVSQYLGDEVVIAAIGDPKNASPVVIAEVRKDGLKEYVDAQFAKMQVKERPQLVFSGQYVMLSPGTINVPSIALNGGLSADPFGKRIAEAYSDGAGFLVAADLARLGAGKDAASKVLGADEARYLVIEQRQINETTESRATLNFAGERHGLASWLAAPAPMGSLDFVSSNATLAAAFVVKEPAKLIDDMFALAESTNKNFRTELQKTESTLGVRVRDDLAASFGNDVTISVDGPVLPVPSWKVIIETHDPVRIQQAITNLVAACNKEKPGCAKLEQSHDNSRTIYRLEFGGSGQGVSYTFTDGYMVAAVNGDTLRRGLRAKDFGGRLTETRRYRSLLPVDRQANFSALVYHNLTEVGAVMRDAMNAAGNLTPEQRAKLNELAGNAKPGLIYAYGLNDRIQVASTGGFFGLTLDNIVSSNGFAPLLHRHQPAKLGERVAVGRDGTEVYRVDPPPGTSQRHPSGHGVYRMVPPKPPQAPQPPTPRG